MKTIKLTKREIEMLLDAIHEWELGVYGQEDECEGSSGFTKKDLKAMDTAKEVLLGVLTA
jgi:hypothetical protein|tara:strand:+ start:971 stop:1150 length:180 start_codon:yes stop_codon:yes gene_type:complete